MKKYLIILALLPLVSACFDSELEFVEQYEPVVEAYLYVGKDLKDVYLSSMISFGSDSLGGEDITDALVILEGEPVQDQSSHPKRFPAVAFAVPDLDAAVEHLRAHGLALPWGVESSPNARYVMFNDPAGNLIELAEFH